ncbi:MAG: S8 family serine peptidase [Vicinamibacteria bacterium]|nr:S8 family serine peptidase [Vicinamibacteria bacterium]
MRILLGLAMAFFGILSQARTAKAACGPSWILARLRPELAAEAEAAWSPRLAAIRHESLSSERLASFAERHAVVALRPLHPALLRERKRRPGLSSRDQAERVRARFASRALRHRGELHPPSLARTWMLFLDVEDDDLPLALSRLAQDHEVEFAERDRRLRTAAIPNDPYLIRKGGWGQPYEDLWGLRKISAPSAWDVTRGDGIVVAVIDSGVDRDHPDLAANIWINASEIHGNGRDDDGNGYVDDVHGWDFVGARCADPAEDNDPADRQGHGTHVAGTIAATGDNTRGIAGLAWESQVMAIRVLDDAGDGRDSLAARGIVYAARNGADVILLAWNGTGTSRSLAEALEYAHQLGTVIVAAAGNESDAEHPRHPAFLPHVISVGASDPEDRVAVFSRSSAALDVVAPGVDILSLRGAETAIGDPVGERYARASGTSMAAAHVSALAALLLAGHPDLSPEAVRQILRTTARDIEKPGADDRSGQGRVDARRALDAKGALDSRILDPPEGAALRGVVNVRGLAAGPGFRRYVLEYGRGSRPRSWRLLHESSQTAKGGALGVFDARALPDGDYTLRLSAFDDAGRTFADQVCVRVDYVAITAPPPARRLSATPVLRAGGRVPIRGTATGPSFHGYDLTWTRGTRPTGDWSSLGVTLAGEGRRETENARLAHWDVPQVEQADYYSLRLRAHNERFTSEETIVVYVEPDLLFDREPRRLNAAPAAHGGMAIVKDAGGEPRVVLATIDTPRHDLPARLHFLPFHSAPPVSLDLARAAFLRPAVGDFDPCAGDETIATDAHRLRIVRGDGRSVFLASAIAINFQMALPVLEDLDGYGQTELLALGSDHGARMAHLHAWRLGGAPIAGRFPISIADHNDSLSHSPAPRVLAADFDGDGRKEILIVEGSTPSFFRLRLYNSDGETVAWRAPAFEGVPRQIAAADIIGDGRLEIVLMAVVEGRKILAVLAADGSMLPGWPLVLSYRHDFSFALGDLDLDGRLEIVAADGPALHVLRTDGSSFSRTWPKTFPGEEGFGAPALADVDGDGYPEILVVAETPAASYPDERRRSSPGVHGDSRRRARETRRDADGMIAVENILRLAKDEREAPLRRPAALLLAMRRDGTTTRSWRLHGANERPLYAPAAVIVPGDLDGDGRLDLAVHYPLVSRDGDLGRLESGVLTALRTETPIHGGTPLWPLDAASPGNPLVLTRALPRMKDPAPPVVSLVSPAADSSVSGQVLVAASASDDTRLDRVEFHVDGLMRHADIVPPYAYEWDTTLEVDGEHLLEARAHDAAGNVGASRIMTISTFNSRARYNAVLRVPMCAKPRRACDSATLLWGRGPLGPEINAPNTLDGACEDGAAGTHHIDASVDRIRISSASGAVFSPGATVRVEVTVWAAPEFESAKVDVFHARDAAAPDWEWIETLRPSHAGAQTLNAAFVLPRGALQAVRAQLRLSDDPGPCTPGDLDERDDLVFAVLPERSSGGIESDSRGSRATR